MNEPARELEEMRRGPGLDLFGLNPFRLLRISADVSSQEAVWKAAKISKLLKAGVEPKDPEPVPWLAPADEIDVQEATQAIEEPMRRIVDQMCWFDFDTDAAGPSLRSALTNQDGTELLAFLEDAPDPEDELAAVAREINQANLRLLLAFSALSDVGPTYPTKPELPGARNVKLSSEPAPNVHRKLALAETGTQHWKSWLTSGFVAWGQLLTSERFGRFLAAKIEAIGDELLESEDSEAIVVALETKLADTLAEEMRLLLMRGSVDRAAKMAQAAAMSDFQPKVWVMAFRPLQHLFTAELKELDPLVGPESRLEDVELYISRLGALSKRWQAADPHHVLGLESLADEALVRAFERLRAQEELVGERGDFFRTILTKAAGVAHSKSLAERIRAYLTGFDDYRKFAICRFCDKREHDPIAFVVVTGQKVTHVEYIGTGTRTHYSLRPAPVPRCLPCADFHQFKRKIGWFASFAPVPLPFVALLADLPNETFWQTAIVAAVLSVVGFFGAQYIVGRFAMPNTNPFDPKTHDLAVELLQDGYTLQSPRWSLNALDEWNQNVKVGAIGGQFAGAIVVIILAVALKVCSS